MTVAPKAQPGIMDIALYQGGASKIDGQTDVLKLSSNENPLGPPPSAIAAAQAAAADMHLYPTTDHADLRRAIADLHDLDPDRIICGVGSDEILHLICQCFVGPGDVVLHTEHGFLMYEIGARAAGATPIKVPERDRTVDVDALLEAASDTTKLVFIANPANPTGTLLNGQDVTRLADGLPDDCILVLDGAYAEYAEDFDGGLTLAQTRPNVMVTRTFSKLYGLGGMRVGWGYGAQEIVDVLNRVRGPFNLSGIALAAAEAAVRDTDFAAHTKALNAAQRDRLTHGLRALGLGCDASYANFVLARFADEAEAQAADAHLKSEGVIVRHPKSYGFPEALRITVGDEDGVTRVLDGLRRFREGQQ
ncbi:MAG: histidinol-phosphate transaminase [Pseudomonadota bacterium]